MPLDMQDVERRLIDLTVEINGIPSDRDNTVNMTVDVMAFDGDYEDALMAVRSEARLAAWAAKVISTYVTEWDVTKGGEPVDPTDDAALKMLPTFILVQCAQAIDDKIGEWMSGEEGKSLLESVLSSPSSTESRPQRRAAAAKSRSKARS